MNKVPPYSLEAEQALLGGCLQYPRYIPIVQKIISMGDMYREAHKCICEALFYLKKDTDLVTVCNFLKERDLLEKAGGQEYILSLVECTSTGAGSEHWAQIIKKNADRRSLIEQCRSTIEECYQNWSENEEILSNLKGGIRLIQSEQATDYQDNKTLVSAVFKDVENRKAAGNYFIGIKTGFNNIDQHLHGLEPKTSNYLIARPSMGKTALGLNIADHVALNYGKVLFFSLESNSKALIRRRLAAHSEIYLSRIRTGNIDDSQWPDLIEAANILSDNNLIIIDRPRYKIVENLISLSETLAMDSRLSLIVVDHIQRMRSNNRFNNRHLELSHISEELSSLANELDIPILILCQLSREIENRPKYARTPRLSDMKESGDLEQNADSVWGLYRESKEAEIAQLEGLKGRDTGTWRTWLRFDRFIQKFTDCQEEEAEENGFGDRF